MSPTRWTNKKRVTNKVASAGVDFVSVILFYFFSYSLLQASSFNSRVEKDEEKRKTHFLSGFANEKVSKLHCTNQPRGNLADSRAIFSRLVNAEAGTCKYVTKPRQRTKQCSDINCKVCARLSITLRPATFAPNLEAENCVGCICMLLH